MPLVSTEQVPVLLFQTPLYDPIREEDEPVKVNVTLSETVAVSMVAAAIAPDPPPPEKKTLGASTYPDPGLVITTPPTSPAVSPVPSTALPSAFVPPLGGSLKLTTGTDV